MDLNLTTSNYTDIEPDLSILINNVNNWWISYNFPISQEENKSCILQNALKYCLKIGIISTLIINFVMREVIYFTYYLKLNT